MSASTLRSETRSTQLVRVTGAEFNVAAGSARQSFWDRYSAGCWEPQTLRVIRHFLIPGTDCIDVGAWIGPTVLYEACSARLVHAFEPDPVSYDELVTNVAANPHLRERVMLHRQCVAPEPGPVNLYAGGMYYAEGSTFGDSMSGIYPAGDGNDQPSQLAEGVRLDDFMELKGVTACSFIKMDLEGGEYGLIPGRWRLLAAYGMPTLCLSFHSPAVARREELIGACLEELRFCYSHLYSATDQALVDVDRLLGSVRDWGDDSPESDWCVLDQRLGAGVVATNRVWCGPAP